MKNLIVLGFLFISNIVFSQTGDVGSAFTNLGHARNVTTPGIYYFDLGGVQFSSYVNSSGMVLVATDFSGAAAANLPQVTALANSGRGILSPAVLASLASATTAQYTTSNGAINLATSNATILSRIVGNATLQKGISDISINADWTGTGEARGTSSTCNTTSGATLNANIHHPCGDNTDFHWIPGIGMHRVVFNSGETPGSVQFNLWVGAPFVALPVTLTGFNAVLSKDKTIQLHWTTETEINSAYFMVERSLDGVNWSEIAKVSAHKNSNLVQSYAATDSKPGIGDHFYRLKMVDLDGKVEYSKIVLVNSVNENNGQFTIYPNPGRNKVYINGAHLGSIKVFDVHGDDITAKVQVSKISEHRYSADFSVVPIGIYVIKGEQFVKRLVIK